MTMDRGDIEPLYLLMYFSEVVRVECPIGH